MNKKLFVILALLMMVSNLVPQPVYAATQNRLVKPAPNGEGQQVDGTYDGGTGDSDNIRSDDAGASTIWFAASPGNFQFFHCWDFEDFVTPVSAITKIRLTQKVCASGLANHSWSTEYCRDTTTGTNYLGTQHLITSVCADFDTFYSEWMVNPVTGLGWDTAALNALEWGTKVNFFATGYYVCITYVYLTVYYAPITVPGVSTGSATGIEDDDATLNGAVTDDGGLTIDRYGFVLEAGADQGDPGNVIPTGPPGTWDAGWQSAAGDYGENTFSIDAQTVWGGVLTKCTTYTYRACAHNSFGGGTWVYGDAVSFTTLCDPLIETQDATYVEATTARLNSLVLDDGGQACDVRFCYGIASANCTYNATCASPTCNCTAYGFQTPWVLNTYTTGQTPYVDVSGLAVNTPYYFCAQIRNDVSCRCGGELSFTTPTGVNEPTDLKGIPFSESLSLFWTKGIGSTNTLVRYKLGMFPTDTGGADGSTLVYFDVLTSILHTELTPGTTYYYTAWGESGGLYSSSNATLMITALAATAPGDDFPTPDTPTSWYQSPDHTVLAAFPLYGWYNWVAECFSVPLGTAWFLGAIFLSVLGGGIAYMARDSHNLLAAVVVTGVILIIFTLMELVSLWVTVPYILIAAAGIMVGERR